MASFIRPIDNVQRVDLKEIFMSDIKDRLEHITEQNLPYFGPQFVLKKEYGPSFVRVVLKYMEDVVGFKINNLKINTFVNLTDLDGEMESYLRIHRMMGYDIPGYYNKKEHSINIRIGIHINKILPVLFHELTHAYIHQNGLEFVDNYLKPVSIGFSFSDLMYKCSQEEGFCEMVATVMSYHVLDKDQLPSQVDEYWLGWRLCLTGYQTMVQALSNNNQNKNKFDDIQISKLAINSLVQLVKIKKNLYNFVQKVPNDAYGKRLKKII